MAYQQQQQNRLSGDDIDNVLDELDDQEDVVIGSELNRIRDELNGKFSSLAQNMEKQLAKLRKKIAQEKQKQAELQQQIQQTNQQCDELKEENSKKTGDLAQINSFYKSDADDQAYSNMLNSIVQRHQQFQQKLQSLNSNDDVGPMNKAWQDEIYKISQLIKASPSKAEFASIVDELKQRSKDVNTLKQIENGSIPYQAINDLVDRCEERHAAQAGDTDATYKPPGKIENEEVLKNNEQWEQLMGLIRDYINAHQQQLQQRNAAYMKELQGRIDDLSQFKTVCLDVHVEEENQKVPLYMQKQHRAKVRVKKQSEANRQRAGLSANVQQRHQAIENEAKATMANNQKDQQELQNLTSNDGGWRREYDQDTKALIEYLV